MSNQSLELLKNIPWLFDLDRSQLNLLANIADVITVNAGEKLFAEGDLSKYFYIVVEGKVDIKIFVPKHDYHTIVVAEPFDMIGWASMTSVVKINAGYAVALQATRLISFQGSQLKHLCDENHSIGYTIMRRLTNVVASRLITTRLHLFEMILKSDVK